MVTLVTVLSNKPQHVENLCAVVQTTQGMNKYDNWLGIVFILLVF